MNGKDLLEGMGYIDDRFVEEAERDYPMPEPARTRWGSVAAMAACLCVVMGFGLGIGPGFLAGGEQEAAEQCPESIGINDKVSGTLESYRNPSIQWNVLKPVCGQDVAQMIVEGMEAQTIPSNQELFAQLGGAFLPDTLLDRELLDGEHTLWLLTEGEIVSDLVHFEFQYGQDLTVSAMPTKMETLPVDGQWMYRGDWLLHPMDKNTISQVGSAAVFFVEYPEILERFAYLILPIPGTDRNLLLQVRSESLSRLEMEQAVTQIVEYGR